MARNSNDSSEWVVFAKSHLAESDEDVDDDYVGLKNLPEVTRVQVNYMFASFIHFYGCLFICLGLLSKIYGA